jgi:hypothetical protein
MVHRSKNGQAATGRRRRINLIADATAPEGSDRLSHDSSIFETQSTSAFSPIAEVPAAMEGTVEAAIIPVEDYYFGVETTALARGGPLNPTADSSLSRSVRARANDLVAELREIGGQVDRMLAQVDRAIDRLAIHTG